MTTPEALSRAPGLYVHVPFCASRCVYCAFTSCTDLGLRDAWLDGLAREVEAAASDWTGFGTVYIGGGTPSVLAPEQLERLVGLLRGLDVHPDAEWTVEANPDDLDPRRLEHLRTLGFERLSLGVQSFDDDALRRLGRCHDAATARRVLGEAHAAGFGEISLDLIYALPGQTLDALDRDLDTALSLEPTHISAYELTLEPGTPLERRVQRGEVVLSNDAEQRAHFLHTARILGDAGWLHYEVCSFASGPQHTSRHNKKYWAHVPYLGLGPGAHSFDGRHRWWNIDAVVDYVTRLVAGGTAIEERETLDQAALRLERLALGFRALRGVDIADLVGHEEALASAIDTGLLVRRDKRVCPTREGMLWADGLAVRFA